MEFNLHKILEELAEERPVFHNERDFQFSLAQMITNKYPEYKVRLEYFLRSDYEHGHTVRKYIDIIVLHTLSERYVAIELKYKTKGVEFFANREKFDLQDHGAQDYGCYAVLADAQRIEELRNCKINGYHLEKGYSIVISNDKYYKKENLNTIFSNYWLTQDREVGGLLDFNLNGRKQEDTCAKGFRKVNLTAKYKLDWKPYSQVKYTEDELPNSKRTQKSFIDKRTFEYLILEYDPKTR